MSDIPRRVALPARERHPLSRSGNMTDAVEKLLTEIRDLQKEHLSECRRVAEQSLRVQALAVKRQARAILISVVALAVIFIGIGSLIFGWAHAAH